MISKQIKAEILSTGDEVLWGDIDDTNSSWLSQKLREAGIEVSRISCVGDSINDIANIIREISIKGDLRNNNNFCSDTLYEEPENFKIDIVLVTGGLGPTSDDLTAEAVSLAACDPLQLNEAALTSMRAYFSKRDWNLANDNIKQAMLPSRAGVMENLYGTAPGFYIELNKTIFFFMPGVPREMKPMYEKSVLPFINKIFFNYKTNKLKHIITRFKLFGLSESKVNSKLKGFNEKFPYLKLGFRASLPLIEVKFSLKDIDLSTENLYLENIIVEAKDWVSSRLEDYIFSYTGLTMEQELGRLLTSKKKTVAAAESCTGGLIGNMITDVAGSSNYFLLSIVAYSNKAKIDMLGVNPDTIAKYGAVHEETVKEMAKGVMNIAGADYGIATSGIAGPGGGTDEKPVGTVCIGVAGKDSVRGQFFVNAYRYNFTFGDRDMNKKMFAVKAMDILRRKVINS